MEEEMEEEPEIFPIFVREEFMRKKIFFRPKDTSRLRPGRKLICYIAVLALLWSISACTYIRLNRQLKTMSDFGRLNRESPFLKVHMLDGRVYVLSQWRESEKDRQVIGSGEVLDLNRNLIQKGEFAIPLDEVALFETNIIKPSPVISGLAVVTGISLGFTIYCIANPKACFGSCPTFYAWNGSSMALQGEGFSASVAPSLEANDVDALYQVKPTSPLMEIQVTNEALETHVIRYANVLAAPRLKSGRVFMTPGGEFWQTSRIIEPTLSSGPEGDCLEKIRSFDGLERFSKTDPEDLAVKETIDLVFEASPGKTCGLILGFRQTLLTTYLFYQGLAYLGNTSGYWLAQLERGDKKARAFSGGLDKYLGGIDIFVKEQGKEWVQAGTIQETGPIATNIQMVPLLELMSPQTKVRLRLTKGLWRLDYIALATLEQKTEPVKIAPVMVVHQKVSEFSGINDQPSSEAKWPLVTMPGDVYSLTYELPSDFTQYELFLETQGYYLEWIRESWQTEKNLKNAGLMFTNPAKFLRKIAPEFKKVEPQMEEIFWRSGYAKTTND